MKRKDLPTSRQLDLAVELLRALSHPARLLALLALQDGPLAVARIQELCGLEQSAMSHQLRTLRDARLVRTERQGKRVLYALHDHHVLHVLRDTLAHANEVLPPSRG